MLNITVTPYKRLHLEGDALEGFPELIKEFSKGSGYGLLYLDVADGSFSELDGFSYWKDFCRAYLSLFAATPHLEQHDFIQKPLRIEIPEEELNRFLSTAPLMKGVEYVDAECLLSLWEEIQSAFHAQIRDYGKDIASFFAARHSSWSLLGRVCFHLVENKNSPDTPFAFLATYVHQVSNAGRSQHLPLSRAIEEYSGTRKKNILLRLLAPLHKASLESAFLKEYVESGDIFHPLAWTAAETYQFLKDIPIFERAGVVVKVPNWWKSKQSRSPKIAVRIGENKKAGVGFNALIDFDLSVMLGEEFLDEKEIRDLLSRSENLVFFKGQWVELDKDKLNDLLTKWKTIEATAGDGITLSEGVRWLAGIQKVNSQEDSEAQSLTRVISGQWLKKVLDEMAHPSVSKNVETIIKSHLKAELRPYQQQGVAWLYRLNQLCLGAVLADDMGLGKTIQVISLLLIKKSSSKGDNPTLLVLPASLIGNWKAELDRFAPWLKYWIAHPSGDGTKEPVKDHFDLLITTYGSVARLPWLWKRSWSLTILDEAQAIKNPEAKQTKAIKAIKCDHRLILTGTPVENRLSDLWSLFDFVSPGLLGSAKDFEKFIKIKSEQNSPYASLRTLVRPYILRRLKTDKSIISDLPDKTELKTFCSLSKAQVALYQKSVKQLANEIKEVDGIQRRGLIFSYLMRFKQICNHPSQFVKDEVFAPNDSGKFLRLKEICDIIMEKQEKVLVFTQFKEMTASIDEFLQSVFGRSGLILHGGTPVNKRKSLVDSFQQESGPPYFILSLKAGGTGLNLTEASHVIHFDRWWNPAVENQATDRVFRIGQKRKVLVHKFICKGTLEEKIDALIESKQNLSKEILEDGPNVLLTELANEDLLKIVSLDIKAAQNE